MATVRARTERKGREDHVSLPNVNLFVLFIVLTGLERESSLLAELWSH